MGRTGVQARNMITAEQKGENVNKLCTCVRDRGVVCYT